MSERLPPAGLRVPEPLLDRASALVDYVAHACPDRTRTTRADVLRRALVVGLEVMEADSARSEAA